MQIAESRFLTPVAVPISNDDNEEVNKRTFSLNPSVL